MKTYLYPLLLCLANSLFAMTSLAPGLSYQSTSLPFQKQTLEIHLIDVDMSASHLRILPVLAHGLGDASSPLRSLAKIVQNHPSALAGISGGYFFEAGQKDTVCEENNLMPPNAEHLSDSLLQVDAKTFAFNCALNPDHRDQYYPRATLVVSGKHAPYIVSLSPYLPLFLNYDEKPDAIGGGPHLISSFWPHQAQMQLGQEGFPLDTPHAVNTAALIALDARGHRHLVLVWLKARPQGLSHRGFAQFLLSATFQAGLPHLSLVAAMALLSDDRSQLVIRDPEIQVVGQNRPIASAILVEKR